MIVAFSPDPPRSGPQAVEVTITDREGHTIPGAFVEASVIAANAPMQTTQGYEDDQGRYVVPFGLVGSGPTSFMITAKTGRAILRATVMTDV